MFWKSILVLEWFCFSEKQSKSWACQVFCVYWRRAVWMRQNIGSGMSENCLLFTHQKMSGICFFQKSRYSFGNSYDAAPTTSGLRQRCMFTLHCRSYMVQKSGSRLSEKTKKVRIILLCRMWVLAEMLLDIFNLHRTFFENEDAYSWKVYLKW